MDPTSSYLNSTSIDNLLEKLQDLETEITKRAGQNLGKIEAKMLYDHITPLYEQLVRTEKEIEENDFVYSLLLEYLPQLLTWHTKVIHLKAKLVEIFSPSPTESEPIDSESKTKHPRLESKPGSRFSHQKYLIEQLDSIKIPQNFDPSELELIDHQLASIYYSFLSSHFEIEKNDDSGVLENQQKINAEFYQKLRQLRTGVKKIPQTDHSEIRSNLDALLKKSDRLIKQMMTLEPTSNLHRDHAWIYKSFASNQTEIGKLFVSQLENSSKIQRTVIDVQTKLQQITPVLPTQAVTSSNSMEINPESQPKRVVLATELETLSSLVNKFADLFISSDKSEIGSSSNRSDAGKSSKPSNDDETEESLQNKLDDVNNKLEEIDNKLDDVDNRLDEVEGRLDEFDGKIDDVENRIDEVDGRVDDVDGRVDDVDGRVDDIENRVDDVEDKVDD